MLRKTSEKINTRNVNSCHIKWILQNSITKLEGTQLKMKSSLFKKAKNCETTSSRNNITGESEKNQLKILEI